MAKVVNFAPRSRMTRASGEYFVIRWMCHAICCWIGGSDERDPCPSEAEGNLHQMDRINVARCHPADEGR